MSGDRYGEGVAPKAAGFMDAILELDEASIPKQVRHAPRRGARHLAKCGDTMGQIAPMGLGVTCENCKATARRKGRAA